MTVKKAMHHKEITLALGILVALLIIFTLWSGRPEPEASGPETIRRISVPIPAVAKSVLQTTFSIFTDFSQ